MSPDAIDAVLAYLLPGGALRFVREQFGVEPDEWQRDVLCEFSAVDAAGKAKWRRMVAVACKGPGKTALLAWLGLYFLATRPHCKIPCISITEANLKDGLWTEFAKWMGRSPMLSKAFTHFGERVVNNEHPKTWWISKRTWTQDANPQAQATDIAGLHEDYLLWLIDECSDIPQGVVDAALAALSSGIETRAVLMGNPTRTDGPLYRACEVEGPPKWHVTHITGDPDDPKRSPRIDLEEAKAAIREYGRDDYKVRVNILGQFPERAADQLLGTKEVEAAMHRELGEVEFIREPKVLGTDVAGFGDDSTIICPRQGRAVFKLEEFRGLDPTEVGEQVIKLGEAWPADGGFVDATGIGLGTVSTLRSRGYAHYGVAVYNSGKAIDPLKFFNKRAECWWLAAEWIKKQRGALPMDDLLRAELCAPKYWFNKGRIIIEDKDDVKARLGRSPDRADAFTTTFAGPVIARTQWVGQGANREQIQGSRIPQGRTVNDM